MVSDLETFLSHLDTLVSDCEVRLMLDMGYMQDYFK